MFLQRPGWHISNASDINRKKVCLSFLIVFLNTPNGAAQSMSQYKFLMRTLGTSRLLKAQRAGLPALHRFGGSVGLWGQGASQREESGRCVSPFIWGLVINCRSRGGGWKAQFSHCLSWCKPAFPWLSGLLSGRETGGNFE